jgi:hypothetical protein
MAGSKVMTTNNLGATFTTGAISISPDTREVLLAVDITNGAGIAPTSTPVGAWTAEWSWDGVLWFLLDDADVATQLGKLAPNGNNIVRRSAKFYGLPGSLLRLTFTRSSGGGAGTACDLYTEG